MTISSKKTAAGSKVAKNGAVVYRGIKIDAVHGKRSAKANAIRAALEVSSQRNSG